MRQAEIRDHLNNFMEIDKTYHLQEIYDYFEASTLPSLQHRIRGASQIAKKKGQLQNIERSGYHTRVAYIQ